MTILGVYQQCDVRRRDGTGQQGGGTVHLLAVPGRHIALLCGTPMYLGGYRALLPATRVGI